MFSSSLEALCPQITKAGRPWDAALPLCCHCGPNEARGEDEGANREFLPPPKQLRFQAVETRADLQAALWACRDQGPCTTGWGACGSIS